MSKIFQKSEFNKMAADILFKENLYAPSIHCSYYGCFQLIKYILNKYFGIAYDDIGTDVASSHVYLQNKFIEEIKKIKLYSTLEIAELHRKIKELKGLRILADYKNEEIKQNTAEQALDYSRDIRALLIKIN